MKYLSIVICAGALAACSSTTPFQGGAVDVTVTADSAVSSSIVLLAVQLSGAETLDVTTPPPTGFSTSGRADVTVRASGTSGTVTVTVTGRNLAGDVVARGQSDAALQKGNVKITVALTAVASPLDMAVAMDLAPGPDLAPYPAIVPSNVSPGRYLPNAPAVSGLLEINTSLLTFTRASSATTNDGGIVESVDAGAVMPAGVEFVVDGNYAVLSTGALTIDRELWVRGTRPLVIVASGPVVIRNLIHVEARGLTPGPGGFAAGLGAGAGGAGFIASSNIASGGGGGGFGVAGAPGGAVCAAGTTPLCTGTPPAPGTPASGATAGGGLGGVAVAPTTLIGGSGGATANGNSCAGKGGGGGGAIQISTSQTIDVVAGGAIGAGGGGGTNTTCPPGGSGGGGAGGMILLEARGIAIADGQLGATGGGGGSFPNAGSDGVLLAEGRGASGSLGGPVIVLGGRGGGSSPPTGGADIFGFLPGGAGGGGGSGVIRFRLPPNVSASLSSPAIVVPAPIVDNTL